MCCIAYREFVVCGLSCVVCVVCRVWRLVCLSVSVSVSASVCVCVVWYGVVWCGGSGGDVVVLWCGGGGLVVCGFVVLINHVLGYVYVYVYAFIV